MITQAALDTKENAAKAIAQFERMMVSSDSKYKQIFEGNEQNKQNNTDFLLIKKLIIN